MIFEPDYSQLVCKGGSTFDIHKLGKLYYLDVCNKRAAMM